jgi:hypothetical protein
LGRAFFLIRAHSGGKRHGDHQSKNPLNFHRARLHQIPLLPINQSSI